jgi:two-component system alkaline phosphatase synthesis response regulator PhoP
MTDRILIVEDDLDIANLMRVNLLELGVEIDHQTDGQLALTQALENDYSVILLDVMLPNMNGLDICRQIRDKRPMQIIIMLTSKNSETDRVLGLELGADDYMTKPFSVRELQARVRSQLRKVHVLQQSHVPSPQESEALCIGTLRIEQKNHQVFLAEQELVLTATEFELLHHLANHPGQVFSRSQLLESVWGYHHSGYEHTVNSHINRLRAKLEKDATSPKIVQTVWGVGYKFNPQGVSD